MKAVWRIEFIASARRELKRLPSDDRKRIVAFVIERIAVSQNPRRLGHPLTGQFSGLCTYRVGDFRLIARIEDKLITVIVLRVANRREVYR